jgi:hypothetical protein
MRIETGTYLVGISHPRWNLFEGGGNRTFIDKINFTQPFQTPPKLLIAMSGFEIRGEYRVSVNVRAERITEKGFDVHIGTINASDIWEVTVNWMAVGA